MDLWGHNQVHIFICSLHLWKLETCVTHALRLPTPGIGQSLLGVTATWWILRASLVLVNSTVFFIVPRVLQGSPFSDFHSETPLKVSSWFHVLWCRMPWSIPSLNIWHIWQTFKPGTLHKWGRLGIEHALFWVWFWQMDMEVPIWSSEEMATSKLATTLAVSSLFMINSGPCWSSTNLTFSMQSLLRKKY